MRNRIYILGMFLIFSTFLFADGLDFSVVNTQAGFDFPTISKINHREDGAIVSYLGANFLLGISYKKFFEPLEPGKFNPYWGIGTVSILIPYFQIGGDYLFDNGFYLGGGLILLAPELHFGFVF